MTDREEQQPGADWKTESRDRNPDKPFSLEPEILRYESALVNGRVMKFGVPDDTKLAAALDHHSDLGMQVTRGYRRWLREYTFLTKKTVELYAQIVWNAVCMTYDETTGKSRPELVLKRPDLRTAHRHRLLPALRYWATYARDGRLADALILDASKFGSTPPSAVWQNSMSREQFVRVLKAIEALRGDPRKPWAWPVLRLHLLSGMSSIQVVTLTRVEIQNAERDGLRVYLRYGAPRMIPYAAVKREVREILSWPFVWGNVADLVSPQSLIHRRVPKASMRIRDEMRHIYDAAGISDEARSVHCARIAAAREYWAQTGNIHGTICILGMVVDEERKRKKLEAWIRLWESRPASRSM